MKRASWPVIDCYMPVLCHSTASNTGNKHSSYNTSLIKIPDTKNETFYKELIAKVMIPRLVMESGGSGSGKDGGVGGTTITSTLTTLSADPEGSEWKSVSGGKRKDRHQGKEDSSHTTNKINNAHPYVVCNTISNTVSSSLQSSMICMDISTSATSNRIACGFQDSIIRVWDVADPSNSVNSTNHPNKVYAKIHQLGRYNRSMYDVIPTGKVFVHSVNNRDVKLSSTRIAPILHSGHQEPVFTGRTGGVYKCHIHGFPPPHPSITANASSTSIPPPVSSTISSGSASTPNPAPTAPTSTSSLNNMIELIGHSKPVYNVSQDYYSNLLVSTSADKTVRIWNTAIAKCVSKVNVMAPCWDVAFGPFGYYYATASHDRTVNIYSTDRLTPLRVMIGHISDVTCVDWHPNAALLVTGSDDRTCRLWDMRSGSCVRYFQAPCNQSVSCISVSPSGMMLAAGNNNSNNNGYIWDIGSSMLIGILTDEHSSSPASTSPSYSQEHTINSICFDSSSTTVSTGGSDCQLKIWNIDSLVIPSLSTTSSTTTATATTLSSARRSIPLISPTHRYYTKNTPIYALSYVNNNYHNHNNNSIKRNVLIVGGPSYPLNNNIAGASTEREAIRSLGINCVAPDVS